MKNQITVNELMENLVHPFKYGIETLREVIKNIGMEIIDILS